MNRGIINDKEVNLKKAKEILDKTNGVLLDVRSHQEYNEEHLPGAININLYDLKKEITDKIKNKETTIVVYCSCGVRSKKAKGWNDYTGEYSQIDSISYEENVLQNDNDYRTNGFGNLKYAMGNFKNDIFGDYIRYTHASCHSYVVMNIDGKILVVNGENDAETKEIYQRISEKVSKERK